MKKLLVVFVSIIIALMIVIGAFLLAGLVFWGLGNLVIYLFRLNYEWTFFHGLGTELIIFIIKLIIKELK